MEKGTQKLESSHVETKPGQSAKETQTGIETTESHANQSKQTETTETTKCERMNVVGVKLIEMLNILNTRIVSVFPELFQGSILILSNLIDFSRIILFTRLALGLKFLSQKLRIMHDFFFRIFEIPFANFEIVANTSYQILLRKCCE